jgi:hypothetical protein
LNNPFTADILTLLNGNQFICTLYLILESESAAVAALSKWFGQQQLSNTSDGVTNLEHMMSVKELEQNQTE